MSCQVQLDLTSGEKKNPKVPAPEVNQRLKQLGVSVSDQIVRNRIHEAGMRGTLYQCEEQESKA